LPWEMLEPYEGKLSRTVLRGERGGNAPDLPGPRGDSRMASLVQDLQKDALNQKVRVTELLQKSLVVATKLKLADFASWPI